MVRKATLGMFLMLLMLICFGFNFPAANAQTATPSKAVITVSGVPAGTKALAVEVTVDTAVLTLGGVSSDVGGVGLADGASKGVGIFSDMDLPTTVNLTVDLTGVAVGMSALSVGKVLDMLGADGVAIAGAMAVVDISSVAVASSSTSTSSTSTSSSTGGTGKLSADTITVTIDGQALNTTNGANVTLAFEVEGVATVDTAGLTFMGTGATQLLTEVKGNVLTVAWDGTITDSKATLTAMLKPGTKSGTTKIVVSKVEVAGGTDVTSSVSAVVTPPTVTNSGGSSSSSSSGTAFVLIGPTSVTGPGKAAISFSASGVKKGDVVKLNGSTVSFSKDKSTGVAIVKLGSDASVPLTLTVGMSTVNLGSLTVTSGSGKAPKVSEASASNKSSGTSLKLKGQNFTETGTTVTIVPGSNSVSDTTVTSMSIKGTAGDCISSGSFVNVSTAGGTSAKKIKAHGSCE